MCKSSKMVSGSTRVIQVTNIAPQATKDQMQTLFGYLGKIDDIRLYPTIRDVSCPVQSRICYVKYYDSATVSVAQHMTNTVFIDRALIVIPMQSGDIPDEHKALEMSNNGTLVPGLNSVEPRLPAHIINTLEGVGASQVFNSHDPKMVSLGLPPYPSLPATLDSRIIEEIRRTVLVAEVGNLGSQQLIDHFGQVGEVKYMRFCERGEEKTRFALVEMTDQESVVPALQLNASSVDGQIIKVLHSTQAIVKPQAKSNEAAQREIEEAMCRVKEAQNLISAAIDPVIGLLSKDKRRTRSRSRSRSHRRYSKRSRSRSRHRSRRSRSRHRHRTRSRSRHRSSRRSRSRSRHRSSRSRRDRSRDKEERKRDKKEPTPDIKKEKSKSPPKEDKLEEKKEEVKPETVVVLSETNGNDEKLKPPSPVEKDEKEVKKRERSKSRDRKRDRSRSKRRSRSRSRRKRSRSRKKSRSRDRKRSKSRDRKRSRSRDRKRSRSRKRTRSRDRKRSRSRDKKRSRSRDRKRSRSRSRRSKSRSHRDSKTPHDVKSRDRSPNLSVIEEKDISINNKVIELNDEKNSPDNMDISNSP